MTKKTQKIILWVICIWLASCLFFGGLSMFIDNFKDKQVVEQTEPVTNLSKIDPLDAQNIIGRWKLTSEIAPQLNSAIVIYEKDDSFFCKETYDSGSSNIKLLRRDGNKFFDTESTFGEYYLVSNGSLRLFDQDGEYGGGKGYSISPLE